MKKTRRLKILSNLAGTTYIIVSVILLIIFGYYIISNALSLLQKDQFKDPNIANSMDNFLFDTVVLVFFFSSIIFTISQLLIYLFPNINSKITTQNIQFTSPYDVILHISTPEEVEVLKAVSELSPRAYKFEIAKLTGLSKMKVHRIIIRLHERDILDVVKVGRNSRITLKDWVGNTLSR